MDYMHKFAHLRTDKSNARWTADTCFRAPHKPLLLLAILDLIEQGVIRENLIQLNADLIDTFDRYWIAVMGIEKYSSPVLPFNYLRSDKFWHFIPLPGKEEILEFRQIRTFTELYDFVKGACLDEALYLLLQDKKQREGLKYILIASYFSPDLQKRLLQVSQITKEVFQYTQSLARKTEKPFTLKEKQTDFQTYQTESRSVAFRRIIIHAYNHTCAMCGIRLVTPEGRTAVVAAHIIPWRESRNDDPRNGMALCGLHHWTFDEGLVSITDTYHICISPLTEKMQGGHKALANITDQPLTMPVEEKIWPSKRALRWHRENVYRNHSLSGLF